MSTGHSGTHLYFQHSGGKEKGIPWEFTVNFSYIGEPQDSWDLVAKTEFGGGGS